MNNFDSFDDDIHEKTKSTALDAFTSKLSATKLSYYEDKYLQILLKHINKDIRKQPIINRGYYTRVMCIRMVVDKFIELYSNNCQIINIGAGFDTTSFHLAERNLPNLNIYEIDFPDIILRKANLIIKSKELRDVLLNNNNNNNVADSTIIPTLQSITTEYGFHLNELHLISSNLYMPDELIQSLSKSGFNPLIPTLILTECVLVYLSKEAVVRLCSSILNLFPSSTASLQLNQTKTANTEDESKENSTFETQTPEISEIENTNSSVAIWMSYDMVHPHDAFGKMMRQNLEVIGGFKVPGFTQYPDLLSHSNRFLESGCDIAKSSTMLSIYNSLIPQSEKIRINRIEMLDEVEEWELLMSHYCVSMGIKGGVETNRQEIIGLIPN